MTADCFHTAFAAFALGVAITNLAHILIGRRTPR
jgi:hypothetical protein